MKRYGVQELADIGSAGTPAWSFRDLPTTGMYGIPAVTGSSPTPAALAFSVAGTIQASLNANGQLISGGTVSLPTNVKLASFGDTWAFLGCMRSYVGSGTAIASRGFRLSIDGSEFCAFSCDNANITISGSGGVLLWLIDVNTGKMVPNTDNTQEIGTSAKSVKNIYLNNQPTIKSDRKYKTDIRDFTEAEATAWAKVSPRLYHLKGRENVITAGYIAQDVEELFASQKLNAFDYGLIQKDADGNLALLYGECQIFEAAYQRYLAKGLERRIAALEAIIGSLTGRR